MTAFLYGGSQMRPKNEGELTFFYAEESALLQYILLTHHGADFLDTSVLSAFMISLS